MSKILKAQELDPVANGTVPQKITLIQYKLLSTEDKKKLIMESIKQKNPHVDFESWGVYQLFDLLDYTSDGDSTNAYSTFLTKTLLFLASPKISELFSKEVPRGLSYIKSMADFFLDLGTINGYYEWVDYKKLGRYNGVDQDELQGMAETYLEGHELGSLDLCHEKDEEEQQETPIFQTDKELIAALDEEFPNTDWPADKLTIAKQPTMLEKLESIEIKRRTLAQETLEQKKAREIQQAVRLQLAMSDLRLFGRSKTSETKPSPSKSRAKPGQKIQKAKKSI